MATKSETIQFLNKELRAKALARGVAVRAEQSGVVITIANKLESRVSKVTKPKKV